MDKIIAKAVVRSIIIVATNNWGEFSSIVGGDCNGIVRGGRGGLTYEESRDEKYEEGDGEKSLLEAIHDSVRRIVVGRRRK